jgi:hypothetical protein
MLQKIERTTDYLNAWEILVLTSLKKWLYLMASTKGTLTVMRALEKPAYWAKGLE